MTAGTPSGGRAADARRNEYRRFSPASRRLVLRGGPLDGRVWEGTAAVGSRVFCGTGAWSMAELYLVTALTDVDAEGVELGVAVPAVRA